MLKLENITYPGYLKQNDFQNPMYSRWALLPVDDSVQTCYHQTDQHFIPEREKKKQKKSFMF